MHNNVTHSMYAGGAGGPQTDNAAITEAEKRVGGTGKKDD
jgi:hypothetical protein